MMTAAVALGDITIYPVIEQQGAWFEILELFPTLTMELLDENRSWLQPIFVDADDRVVLCIQSLLIKTPHHNILIDACVGNHKPRPQLPFWNMMNSDRFEKGLADADLTVGDIDYMMCTHLRSRWLEHTVR
jgi:glyoxylase-like metal-dependent hydrolase (beta-lactamase superfamily II)